MKVDPYDISFCRGIVSLSFILNIACQLYYGLFANPSIKQVADVHYSAFSPNAYFIVAFFIFQIYVQFFFVRGLFSVTATPDEPTLSERFCRFIHLTPSSSKSDLVDPYHTYYSLPFALGNVLHIAWTVFWMQEMFWAALPMVIINTLIQFYWGVLMLSPLDPEYATAYEPEVHLIARLTAGVGYLGILDTAATAAGYVGPPSASVQVIIVLLFVTWGAFPDGNALWNFAILFDILALWAGQPTWSTSLALVAGFVFLEIVMLFLLLQLTLTCI